MPLLSVDNLSVTFGHGDNISRVVRGVSFEIARGETLALVGESGSGKSVTALSLLQLLPYPNASHPTGSITFEDKQIIGAKPAVLQGIRGNRIGMVFQEPMTSLNPLHTIGRQIAEVLFLHKNMNAAQARARVLELLHLVALPDPEKRMTAYPHELSGGQRQRVMIAMALANDPVLLIADEPTTALDVTIQAQILQLLKDLQQRLGMALLLITHDLGIVRKVADRVCVMQHGEIVEQAPVAQLFTHPQHPYTRMLLAAEPKGAAQPLPAGAPEILNVDDLKVYFPIKKGLLRRVSDYVRAVDGVSLRVRAGETVGIVGESGSGKTTLGLGILRLLSAQGRVVFMGRDIAALPRHELRALRKSMQIVFQDPFGSLSPRMSAGDIIAEGLDIHKMGRDCSAPASEGAAATAAGSDSREARVIAALKEVGLDPETRHRYPHEFSGGQRQRISIARAVILQPKLIVLDEPTSALDVSVQAQIVELLRDLQRRHGLGFIFISHDLRVVRALAHHVVVMKAGKMVEQGDAATLFAHPQQSYTKALLAAALNLDAVETA
ncbi:MAG: ABC transporter ATP-binding protein [Alphaproteobacteria bacterium]|nr:ABC transporter ATP-binding protein [Alphaproteobacteria bacterium]